MYDIKRSDEEIDNALNWCIEDDGRSHYPGMSYEQGIEAALLWVTGQNDDDPSKDD